MHEQPNKAYHNEQAESSKKKGSNENIIEMLAIMEKIMQERDNKLRAQLQLRDEYYDVELRKRDQFIEES